MKRLITDNPKDNIQTALNLFYIKDGWTWVRGGGPAPEFNDVSLCDYVRDMVKNHIPDEEAPGDDNELSMLMAEWLFDGIETAEGIIATIYTAGWAFAELRHKLKAYEDLEEAGRLLSLPCAVNDTTWYADEDAGRVLMGYVSSYQILSDGAVYFEFTNIESDVEWVSVELLIEEFGKTVFMAREEAEKALEGGDRDG